MANADLRPMTLGEVLDRTFTIYREHFLLFAGITALPYLLMLVFNFGVLLIQRSGMHGSPPSLTSPGLIGGIVAGAIGGMFLFFLMIGVAHAATVSAVSDLYLGQPTSVRAAYAQAKGSIWIVIAVMFMSFLATVVGLFLFLIPGIYLACRLAVSIPVAVVEKESPVGAMERSMELTKGYGWQIFLLLLLVAMLGWVVAVILEAPGMVFTFLAAIAKQQPSIGATIYTYLAQYVAQVIVGPIGTISSSLMYFNLRVRKEGFDIQYLMNTLSSTPRPLADPSGIQ